VIHNANVEYRGETNGDVGMFNAMKGIYHREPGTVETESANWRSASIINGGVAQLKRGGTLASSMLTMGEAFRYLVKEAGLDPAL
jgi:N-acetylglucosamine-6-phosphate deacetylase